MYKIMHEMGVTYKEKTELDLYQLKDVSKVLFTQWKGSIPVESGPLEWEFKEAFLKVTVPVRRGRLRFRN